MPSSDLGLIARATVYGNRTAIVDDGGRYSYRRLLDASGMIARRLLAGAADMAEQRVVFLMPPDFLYVATLWGIWRAGGIAVPLSGAQRPAEWNHVIADSRAASVVTSPGFESAIRPVAEARGARVVSLPLGGGDPAAVSSPLPHIEPARRALMLYTSGTTSHPKGVVLSGQSIQAQLESLATAWEWSNTDRILNVLPLHHTHGLINVVISALWSGAVCEIQPGFDASRVWQRIADGGLTLFMAVPTIYAKLIGAWEATDPERRAFLSERCRALRLMVSGSAALPTTVLERWRAISGHVLLERYGMTEIGMALSNPLHGERRPGFVGVPLPGVDVRLVDEDGRELGPGVAGEIEVRGPGIFLEYWDRPEAASEAFRNGWFRTGDVAVLENGMCRILGRRSVDIIKTGGYKVSALEVEEVLRSHPDVRECAVVGVDDPEWGERVCAVAVLNEGRRLMLEELRTWAGDRLARYKVPTRLVLVDELPRNAMGKVVKARVKELVLQRGPRPPHGPARGHPLG
jgi:malonyl-CoA/methylmalonyl-CoA synthetase